MKLKNLKVNFTLIAFAAFTIKMLILQPTIADSIVILVLASLYGYSQYIKRFQPYNLDEAVKKDLIEVKTALSKLNMIQSVEKMKDRKYF